MYAREVTERTIKIEKRIKMSLNGVAKSIIVFTTIALTFNQGAFGASSTPSVTKKPTITSVKPIPTKKATPTKKPTTSKKPTVKPSPIIFPSGKPTVLAPGSTLTPPTSSPRPSLTNTPKPEPQPICSKVAELSLKMYKDEAFVKNSTVNVKVGQAILIVIDSDSSMKATFSGTNIGTINISPGLSAICVAYPLIGSFPIAVGDLVPVIVTAA